MVTDKEKKFLYENIVENYTNQISKGVLKPGEKLPSVRKLCNELNVSKNTIIQAYTILESEGLIDSKAQSGFFVKKKIGKTLPEVEIQTLEAVKKNYNRDELISNTHEIANIPNLVSFGGGVPSNDMLPMKKLNKIMLSILRDSVDAGMRYEFPPGYYKLRREIAKISSDWGGNITADEVLITTGAVEGIILALQSIAKPGDTIITESPTFYLVPQIIKGLGMNILEVPNHPKKGISIIEFKKAVSNSNIAGCLVYPTVNSPTGSIMPEENRKDLYNICASNKIPIIECDVWGELHFLTSKPKPIKYYDDDGLVVFLSSFTKTGAPGLRTGWVLPGKYFKIMKEKKYAHTIATSTLSQMAAAEYIKTGTYYKSIKNLRNIYKSRISTLSKLVSEFFPNGTKLTRPQGGPFLWVELPSNVDSVKLQELSINRGITFNPGPIFTTSNAFVNHLRLSCVCRWEYNEIESAVKVLGELCNSL